MRNTSTPGSNIVDLLWAEPSTVEFEDRVRRLQLSEELENKVLDCHDEQRHSLSKSHLNGALAAKEEQELAAEVLYYRYRFTLCTLRHKSFRQAALTVIQNIFLFQNRHIFFQPFANLEEERSEALEIFSSPAPPESISLKKSFRHPVLARIWARIVTTTEEQIYQSPALLELHSIVEKLNTLRNIYMLFSARLIRTLAHKINPVYKQSLSHEDALQVGYFGVARAAYRYHHSSGVRFSTYAANWIFKEFQQQSLNGRLIRISSNVVENYSRSRKASPLEHSLETCLPLPDAVAVEDEQELDAGRGDYFGQNKNSPEGLFEKSEDRSLLKEAVDTELNRRSADILRRRFGLPPYESTPQSIIEIAETYGLTRGRVYQIEQHALEKLRSNLSARQQQTA